MTQDEIIRSPLGRDQIIDLAREASPDMTWYAATEDPTQVATEELEFLERFAALVAEPWIETNKALAKEIIELQKQAEQRSDSERIEPVGWARTSESGEVLDCISHTYKVTQPCTVDYDEPLYAAPVRTKDLTDDEISTMGCAIYGDTSVPEIEQIRIEFARAVVAKDREKNK